MGRYYYCNSGREGKFWFAVQPSTDPKDIYGMNEVSIEEGGEEEGDGYGTSWVDYEGYDSQRIKRRLDKQFDILGVPKEERKYKLDDVGSYVWNDLRKYFLTTTQQNKEDIGYAMMDEDNDTSWYPLSKERVGCEPCAVGVKYL